MMAIICYNDPKMCDCWDGCWHRVDQVGKIGKLRLIKQSHSRSIEQPPYGLHIWRNRSNTRPDFFGKRWSKHFINLCANVETCFFSHAVVILCSRQCLRHALINLSFPGPWVNPITHQFTTFLVSVIHCDTLRSSNVAIWNPLPSGKHTKSYWTLP